MGGVSVDMGVTLSGIGARVSRKRKSGGTKREAPFYWIKACHSRKE